MRRAASIAALLLAAALLVPIAAFALEGPRAEYRDQVEPICKAEGEAKDQIAAGLRPVPGGPAGAEVKKRGRQLVRESTALAEALAKLRAVPRPEADAQKLAKWLAQISDQVERLRKAGKAAIAGKKPGAQKLINQFANASPRANNLVVSFEFRHCVFEEAGFTS